MKKSGMNEARFLSLLEKVLPRATQDPHLATRIYDEVQKEVRLIAHVEAFEKFCEKGSIPDVEPETMANLQTQLASELRRGECRDHSRGEGRLRGSGDRAARSGDHFEAEGAARGGGG